MALLVVLLSAGGKPRSKSCCPNSRHSVPPPIPEDRRGEHVKKTSPPTESLAKHPKPRLGNKPSFHPDPARNRSIRSPCLTKHAGRSSPPPSYPGFSTTPVLSRTVRATRR